MQSFSARLLAVPLFQGFSRLDFLDIVEKTPLDFRTVQKGEVVVEQGRRAAELILLLVGEMQSEMESPQHSYRYVEQLAAPHTIQIERLFGLHNAYTRTFRATNEAQFAIIDKESVRRLLTAVPTFQINFFNALSTQAQNYDAHLWERPGATPELRFRQFLHARSLRPVGRKTLYIKMEELAEELRTTRLQVSHMLARLGEQGLVEHSRGAILIPRLEAL